MTLRVFLARLLSVLMLVTLAVTASPPATADSGKARAKYASSAVQATHHVRDARGRAKLRRHKCLQRFANQQARRMAQQRRIFHQDLGRIQRRCHVGLAGENVAYGYRSGRAVVRAFMRSRGHRANILRPHYRLMAVGARKAGGVWWVAQVFGRRG